MGIGAQEAIRFLAGTADDDLAVGSKVFVIGPTGVGKTTFCRALETELAGRVRHVAASDWIRSLVPCPAGASRREHAAVLAQESIRYLAADPEICVRAIRQRLNAAGGGVIIDGLRNPRDFALLFDACWDYVVFLERDGIEPCNAFEQGIGIIRSYVGWAQANMAAQRRTSGSGLVLDVDLGIDSLELGRRIP